MKLVNDIRDIQIKLLLAILHITLSITYFCLYHLSTKMKESS